MKFRVKIYNLHFNKNFKIAYETVTSTRVVVLELIDNLGNIFLGSAAPDEKVTGEKLDKVCMQIKNNLPEILKKIISLRLSDAHKLINDSFKNYPSAIHAVEEAWLNYYAEQKKCYLSSFFNNSSKSSVKLGVTIGINDCRTTVNEVKQRIKQGYEQIKLKCGINLNDDIYKIMEVLKILPIKYNLFLDANQGYTFLQAEKLLKSLPVKRIGFLEQPVKAENLAGLKKLKQLKLVPILADESVVTKRDITKILKGNYADGVNIKLMKCGGPLNFLEIYWQVKKMNKLIMIGCMYESNISITTGVSLALALNLDYVELDSGHFDFKDDPASGGAFIKRGQIYLGHSLKLKKKV